MALSEVVDWCAVSSSNIGAKMISKAQNRIDSILSTRIDGRTLLIIELYSFIVISSLVNFALLPASSLYIFDVINIVAYIACFKKCRAAFSNMKWFLTFIDFLVIYCIASAVLSLTEPQYVIWELNAVLRLFVFLSMWSAFCEISDLKNFLSVLYNVQLFNLLFAFVQFFVLGLKGDNCGGLFGNISGCNAYTNIYLCIVCGYAMNSFLARGEVGLIGVGFTSLISLCVATFSEIKFFYFEFLLILVVSLWSNRFTIKTIALTVFGMVALVLGLQFLATYYPDSYDLLLDSEAMMAYDDGSQVATSGYGISRSSPIPQIDEIFFNNDSIERVFGLGFGSAAVSSIEFFSTPFYRHFGFLRYYYSPVAMLYLQCGWVGVIVYFLVFASLLFCAIGFRTIFREVSPGLYGFAISMIFIFCSNCFYNATARSFSALLWAVVLSAPVLLSKCKADLQF